MTMHPVASPRRRPLLGLRQQPGRLALAFMRMPLRAYRHDAGWIFGHTFLEFTHVGRRTGQPHDAVALVLRYDAETREAVICAAWGLRTDWYRNLLAGPATAVRIGRDSYVPEHRVLPDDEAFDVVAQYRRRHPYRFRLVSRVLGWGDLRDDRRLREAVHDHPFVAFRPRRTG